MAQLTQFTNIAAVEDDDAGISTTSTERAMMYGRDSDQLPLHKAILKGDEQKVDKLLKNATLDLDMQDEYGNTPLHCAAITGSLKMVKNLISRKWDTVNTVNNRGQTSLHLAAQHDSLMVTMELLEKGANKDVLDNENLTPVLTAAKHGCPTAVHVLLENNAKINKKDKKGKTVIHLATENKNVNVLKILLNHKEKKQYTAIKKQLNIEDNEGKTPLLIAAHRGDIECLNELLKNGADVYHTCGEDKKTAFHFAAEGGWTKVVEIMLKSWIGLNTQKDRSGKTALHGAIIHGMKQTAEILLQYNADADALDNENRTPLSYAAEKGQFKCAKVLLRHGAKLDMGETLQEKLTPVQFAAQSGNSEIQKLLAEENKKDKILAKTDFKERNCLDIAIEKDQKDTVLTIIQTDQWQDVLRNQTPGFETPMRKLIRYMPDAAREVFNRCTKVDESVGAFKVTFNYEFLDDTLFLSRWRNDGNTEIKTIALPEYKPYTSDSEKIRDNHPLMIMVTSDRKELLHHPLVTALLKKKWNSVGLLFHWINFLVFAVYVAMLTGFILDIKAPFQFANISRDDEACSEENVIQHKMPKFAAYVKYVVIILAALELVKEIFELVLMFSCKFWRYFMVKENILEWITYITSILFVVNMNDCEDTGYRPQWQWTCGTVSVFLSWINLMMFTQKFDLTGIYVVMFYRIVKVFLKFFFVFSLLIVAFSVSFHCLFQNQNQFATFWTSLVKTTAMMIGEMDFGTIFYEGHVHYEVISYLFFYIFMLFMAIVIINLLIGLSVSNIQEFQDKAGLNKKEMQVKFALEFERRFFTTPILWKCVPGKFKESAVASPGNSDETMKPNGSWDLTEENIRIALNTEEGTGRQLIRLNTKVTLLESYIKDKMKTLNTNLLTMTKSLNKLKDMEEAEPRK